MKTGWEYWRRATQQTFIIATWAIQNAFSSRRFSKIQREGILNIAQKWIGVFENMILKLVPLLRAPLCFACVSTYSFSSPFRVFFLRADASKKSENGKIWRMKEQISEKCIRPSTKVIARKVHRFVLLCYLIIIISYVFSCSFFRLYPFHRLCPRKQEHEQATAFAVQDGLRRPRSEPITCHLFSPLVWFFFVRTVQKIQRKRQKRVSTHVYEICIATKMTCENSFRNIRALQKLMHVASWNSTFKLIFEK